MINKQSGVEIGLKVAGDNRRLGIRDRIFASVRNINKSLVGKKFLPKRFAP